MEESIPIVCKKQRLSLFNPNKTASSKSILNKSTDYKPFELEYIEIINKEKEGWKKLYDETKATNKALIKEFEQPNTQTIDTNLLIEDDLNFLNDIPNFAEFVRDAQGLESLVKVIALHNKEISKRKKRFVKHFKRVAANYTLQNNLKFKQFGTI